ncbi:MAG: DNA repair protein RecO [Bacillota bacterium]|nr:MAG: DNA repair protein RecO [Bacillota bacterium]
MLKVNALMIKSVDYADNDKILTLFSLEQGVISAKIRGVKKAGAKLKFAAEPFCFAEYVLTEGSLKSVANASLTDSFYPLREDLFRYYAAGAAAELVKRFCPENVVHAPLFLKTVRLLNALAYTPVRAEGALAWYLLGGLKEIGYSLQFDCCADCGAAPARPFFDFNEGSVYCEECRKEGAAELSRDTYKLLKTLTCDELPEESFFAGLAVGRTYYLRALRLINRALLSAAGGELSSLREFIKLYDFAAV